MSIALVVSENRDAIALSPWAIRLAHARDDSLLLIYITRMGPRDKQAQRVEIDPPAESDSDSDVDWGEYASVTQHLREAGCIHDPAADETPTQDAIGFRIVQWQHSDPAAAVRSEIGRSAIKALVLRRGESDRDQSFDRDAVRDLLSDVPCEILQIRIGPTAIDNCQSIMVPCGPGAHSAAALAMGAELADSCQAKLSAVYVEPDVDLYAQQVGTQILDRTLSATLGGHADDVDRRIVLDEKVRRGIRSVLDDYDVVVVGSRHHGRMHRWLVRGLSEELLTLPAGPTVIAVRSAAPLSGRIASAIDRAMRNGIPQLERSQRIAVVERIQSSSKWDFDFIALVCLSTLIATGGLIQNSAAVVIGAMLVAPLMTPLLGAGLSLVQGNLVLLRSAMQSIARGFLLAVALGFLIGWIWPGVHVTAEMSARGAPHVLDLLVAFISGTAAAYAIGRPNLLSALPGVAIAAALVPPIATLGLSLSLGEWRLAIGAGLLFVTNIVAIVLGTACSFLAVGIRGSHAHGAFQSRSLRVAIGLIVLFVGLGIYESLPKHTLPNRFSEAVSHYLAGTPEVSLVSLRRSREDGHDVVEIAVESPGPISKQVTAGITKLAEKEFAAAVQIRIVTRLVTTIQAGPGQRSR